MFLDWKNQYCYSGHTTEGNLQIHAIYIKIPMAFFTDLEKINNFKVCMET